MKISKPLFLLIISTTLVQLSSAQASNVSPFDTTIYGKNEKVGRYVKNAALICIMKTYGNGEPLLMIHGNGGSINGFQ